MTLLEHLPKLGTPVEFSFDDYVWEEDLVWYDGPMTSVFRKEGIPYVSHWVTRDDEGNRWLLVECTDDTLQAMIDSQLPLRDFLMAQFEVLLVDSYSDNTSSACVLKTVEVPEDYFPLSGVTLRP